MYLFQLKLIPVSLAPVVVNIAMDLTQLCSCLISDMHCSLRGNGLTDTGAIALARALHHNKSLEELK